MKGNCVSGSSTITGTINIGASTLAVANVQALGAGNLVSVGGKLALNDVVLPILNTEGPVQLLPNVRTTGDQTYMAVH